MTCYNQQGLTVDSVTTFAYPGTDIVRKGGITIIAAVPDADNIGSALTLPADADEGDLVEVYNVYVGGNPSQNAIGLYPPPGENINFSSSNVGLAAKAALRFRKIGPSDWFAS